MARHLSDADIAAICELLDGWRGQLTWNALIDAVEERCGYRYTRQALHGHVRISAAFKLRKKALRNTVEISASAASFGVHAMQQRLMRLEAENTRLKFENTRLLEQFVRWAYNASLRGLDHHFLNQSLPSVDRERTVFRGNSRDRPKG